MKVYFKFCTAAFHRCTESLILVIISAEDIYKNEIFPKNQYILQGILTLKAQHGSIIVTLSK